MSFTTDIKSELCHVPVTDDTAMAECLGMLLFAGQFSREGLRIQCEMPAVRRRVQHSLNQYLDLWPEESDNILQVWDTQEIDRIYAIYGYERESSLPLNRALVEEEAARSAFLRGAFLVCGAVTDPEKDYPLEFAIPHYNLSRDLLTLLREVDFPAKSTTRGGNHIVYIKGSEAIEDCLTYLGATRAALEMMGVKMVKSIRNDTNRRINCESANIDKTVQAAGNQLDAVRKIQETCGLSALPEDLQQVAQLRWDNPELSLRDLGALMDPPLTRSGINHRLQRILKFAENLEG